MNRLALVIIPLILLLGACTSGSNDAETSPNQNDTDTTATQQEDIKAYAQNVDREVELLEQDPTSERKNKTWELADGTGKMNAWYKDEKLLMIQEENISSKQAQLHRYYFKENKLVYATEYSVDKACNDSSDVCVNEMRCYFDNERMVCEYTRAISIPTERLDAFDDPYLKQALDSIELQQYHGDPSREPVIKQGADELLEKWEEKGDA